MDSIKTRHGYEQNKSTHLPTLLFFKYLSES